MMIDKVHPVITHVAHTQINYLCQVVNVGECDSHKNVNSYSLQQVE